MADETVVTDTPAAPVDAAPVDTAPVAPPVADGAPVDTAPVDADPALLALEEAMKAGLPADDPADVPAVTPEAAVAPQFEGLLKVSPFVTAPEHVEAAVRAADEVWKVATGQLPARNLLEGMRGSNPEGYNAVIQDLTGYIEAVTDKKFGGAPDTPPDPVQARLAEIERGIQQDKETRQQAIYAQQMTRANGIAMEAVTKAAKGTAFEGSEAYLLQQCASKVGIPEKDMVQALIEGKTETLTKALKAVQKEETVRLKKYNENLIRNYRTLKNAVPATPGAPAIGKPATGQAPPYKPGETATQYATRVWNSGQF